MSEEKLEKELEMYKELAKDKKIDVTSLMINALEKHQSNLLDPKQKRWAYLVSLVAPPIGLFYAIKFYYSGKDDANESALMCVILTVVGLLLLYLFTKALLSGGTGASLKTLKPSDVQQLVE